MKLALSAPSVVTLARAMLDRAGVRHRDHVRVGRKAQSIVDFAREVRCERIVLAEPASDFLSGLRLGGIAGQIRQLLAGADPGCEVV